MKPGIQIAKIWSDNDAIELKITVSDGSSSFTTNPYVGHTDLARIAKELWPLKKKSFGPHDLNFGTLGPEFAGGAFHARFYFLPKGIFITCDLESQFETFG